MSIFDRFWQKKEQKETILGGNDLLSALLCDGAMLTREQIINIPQVAADIDIISSTFATIPFRLYHRTKDEDGREKIISLDDDPRVILLNNDTNDTVDPYMLKKAMCEDYFLSDNGGGYAYIDKSGNHVTALRYVKSEDVGAFTVDFDPLHRSNYIAVAARRYDDFNFIKLLRNSRDGIAGESIVKEVNTALQVSYEALKYQRAILKKGGSKKGFIQTKQKIEGEELNGLKENWRRLYSNDNERAIVLNSGLEFKETSSSTAEMQMDETKQTLNKEIDAIFHISDDQEKFIRRAILPIGTAFEAALNKVLLQEKEKADHFWEADYSELLKASMKERFEAYREAKNSGWITINEIRGMENLETIEGMDVLNVGLNAALYSLDGELDRDRFYIPNTDTAERRQLEGEKSENGSEKGEEPDE